jgi:hypothetical protein
VRQSKDHTAGSKAAYHLTYTAARAYSSWLSPGLLLLLPQQQLLQQQRLMLLLLTAQRPRQTPS